jgi:hypothetical protein
MIPGFLSQVRTSKATGDVTLAVEVTKDKLNECAVLNMSPIVIMSEVEFMQLHEKLIDCEKLTEYGE